MKRLSSTLAFAFDHLSHTNNSIKHTGLFGYSGLDSPSGLADAAKSCIQQASIIVEQVIKAENDEEIRKTVKRVDTISDILCSVLDSAELIRNVHPDQRFIEAANNSCTVLHTFLNQLNTNQGLYYALKKVLDRPTISADLTEHEKKVVSLLLRDFEKSGVQLPLRTRNKFIELNDTILQLGQKFSLSAHPYIESLNFNYPEQTLAGTPPKLLDALCRSSNSKNITIPTHSEIASVLMRTAHSDAARKDLFFAMNSASKDQIYTLELMLKKRGELARLLGKASYGHLYLDDKMAESPENVSSFLNSLSNANYPFAYKEFDSLLNIKKQVLKRNDVTFEAWDRYYYAQYVEPLFDKNLASPNPKNIQNNLSNYFSVGNVFSGLSDVFYSMYGVRFEIQDTIPGEIWHKDVRKLAVVHEHEGIIGTIYCDLFQRDSQDISKYDNAAHFTVRCCRRIDNDEPIVKEQNWRMNNDRHERLVSSNGKTRKYQIPIVVLVTSFSPLKQGIPSLMDLSDIETLFHEMGHAMHSMLSQTDFQHVSGTRVAMDFVEVPSILMEYFSKSPEVLSSIGKHYKTLEKVPMNMILSKQHKQKLFTSLETQNQLQMALLDQEYHSELAFNPDFDTSEIMYCLSKRMNPLVTPRPSKWQVQFSHLFTYGASYYTYNYSRRWASRIFQKHFAGTRDSWRKGGELLRSEVLGVGGGRDPWIGLEKIGVAKKHDRHFRDSSMTDLA